MLFECSPSKFFYQKWNDEIWKAQIEEEIVESWALQNGVVLSHGRYDQQVRDDPREGQPENGNCIIILREKLVRKCFEQLFSSYVVGFVIFWR
jgi:hypothetical protein